MNLSIKNTKDHISKSMSRTYSTRRLSSSKTIL